MKTLTRVVRDGKSLAELLPAARAGHDTRSLALLQALTFGVARWSLRLDQLLLQLLHKPLRNRDVDVRVTLWMALYEAEYLSTPDYAVADSYVKVAKRLRKSWARGLVNATIRKFMREREQTIAAAQASPAALSALPAWLEDSLASDWPDQAAQIIVAGNQRAPLTLRANLRHGSRANLLQRLTDAGYQAEPAELSAGALSLMESTPVEQLPGYADGDFSVQDSAAQLAAELLAPQPGHAVLDACAAPGGKTCHLLEYQPQIKLLALDSEASRLRRVEENLARLKLSARVVCGDAGDPSGWWDGEPFDRILLDAPCSALGVLRRRPDIRLLRRESDIPALAQVQAKLLRRLWPLLQPGGRLVYATCSILRRENEQIVEQFLAATADAREQSLDVDWGHGCRVGRQILPGQHQADGFYYAILSKV